VQEGMMNRPPKVAPLLPRMKLPVFIGNCRRCGHSLLREDAFCPSCGLQVDYGAHVK